MNGEHNTAPEILEDQHDELEENDTEDDLPAHTPAAQSDADVPDSYAADAVNPDTDAVTGPRALQTAPEPAWLDALAERWQAQHRDDLAVRHETGRLINQEIGPKRQARGKGIVKTVAAKVGVDESDIRRMRKFALTHPDLTQFRAAYPEVTTWTRVKEHLAPPRPRPATDSASEKRHRQKRVNGRLENGLPSPPCRPLP
jgi:hypothetical protein